MKPLQPNKYFHKSNRYIIDVYGKRIIELDPIFNKDNTKSVTISIEYAPPVTLNKTNCPWIKSGGIKNPAKFYYYIVIENLDATRYTTDKLSKQILIDTVEKYNEKKHIELYNSLNDQKIIELISTVADPKDFSL